MTLIGISYSMKNSRRLVVNKRTGKPMFIKSSKAVKAFHDFVIQAKAQWDGREPIPPPAHVSGIIYYPNRRFDLDPSMLFDILQVAGVVKNDRHIMSMKMAKGLSPDNPRIEIEVMPME